MNYETVDVMNYTAVSFDIFDTLIKRMVTSPIEVFHLVEKALDNTFGIETHFYEKRIDAKNYTKNKNRYYCIDDIYAAIDLSQEQKKVAIRIEKETEIEICYPNKEIVDFFNRCKKQDKKIYLISDMYLDRKTIEAMLEKCGISGYLKMYISHEINKEKNGGDLFAFYLKENNLKASSVLHIGDNSKVDIISAKLCGMHTKKVRETFNAITYRKSEDLNKKEKCEFRGLLRLLEAHKSGIGNEWQSIGYECLGPLFWGFSNWLAKKLKDDKIDNVFFLSREGEILQKAFEALHRNEFACHYLYVSRRSLRTPSYAKCKSFDEIVKDISLPKSLTVKQFYDAIGIDYSVAENGVKAAGLTKDTILNGWEVDSNVALSQSFNYIKDKAFEIYSKQYSLINKYLNQNNFIGKVAIVDIGWNGTMQRALEDLCNQSRKVEIHGYYFGINEKKQLANSFTNGYIYDSNKNIEFQYYLMGMSGPLEMMMTAQHGTTLGYYDNRGNVFPILAKSEYFEDEKKIEAEPILEMQFGALHFVYKVSQNKFIAKKNIDGRIAIQNFYQFGKDPVSKHMKMFYGLKEYDGSVSSVMLDPNTKGLIGKHSVIKGFWQSSWKIAYLKDKIHVPLPYHKIYFWMRRKKR